MEDNRKAKLCQWNKKSDEKFIEGPVSWKIQNKEDIMEVVGEFRE